MDNDGPSWFVGIDWASQKHDVCVLDGGGKVIGERSFAHGGVGLGEMADWISRTTGAPAEHVAVAIEVPHGPVVEGLMERGFRLFAINPKQLDRFRDRFSPAGAKDDSRDARALGDAVRTDRRAFRPLAPLDPVIVELREWSRIAEDFAQERVRLVNRLRDQLWRYFPQVLDLSDDLGADWIMSLLLLAPTPERARRVRKGAVETLLKRHRIRRIDADGLIALLRTPAIRVAPGTVEAASAHVKILVEQIARLNRDRAKAHLRIDELTTELAGEGDDSAGQSAEQRDVAILNSLPGIGRINLATLLAEASEPLRRRDYHALRCLTGVAPVTRRSGKARTVQRRRAAHPRLVNAVYYWANSAIQHDARSRAKYQLLRQRGHNHARALRSVADRLLFVTCKLLEAQAEFDQAHVRK